MFSSAPAALTGQRPKPQFGRALLRPASCQHRANVRPAAFAKVVLPLVFSTFSYFQFRLKPEFLIPADRTTVPLPQLVGTRSDFFLRSPSCTPPLQLLFQFFDPRRQPLISRRVIHPRRYSARLFDLALQLTGVLAVIHSRPSSRSARV